MKKSIEKCSLQSKINYHTTGEGGIDEALQSILSKRLGS